MSSMQWPDMTEDERELLIMVAESMGKMMRHRRPLFGDPDAVLIEQLVRRVKLAADGIRDEMGL